MRANERAFPSATALLDFFGFHGGKQGLLLILFHVFPPGLIVFRLQLAIHTSITLISVKDLKAPFDTNLSSNRFSRIKEVFYEYRNEFT